MAGTFFDPNLEFDVPAVDFSNPLDYDEDVVSYFDVNHEHDIDLGFGPSEPKRARDDAATNPPRRSLRNTPARQKKAARVVQEVPAASSDVTSSTVPQNPETPTGSPKRPRTRSLGATKEKKSTAKRDPNYKPAGLCTSLSEWNRKTNKAVVTVEHNAPKQAKRVPVKALAPAGKAIKSSEELELEKINALREEALKQKRRAERSHRRVLSSGSTLVVKPSQSITKVEEFAFATDKRIHETKGIKTNSADMKDFSTMLRHYEPLKPHKKGPTVPLECPLYQRKRKHSEDRSAKESAPLWSKTPERFHSLPRNAKFIRPSNKRRRSQSYNCKITLPVTPKLECMKRARPVHVISQKEIEEKEAADVKSYKFKARPLNERIFKNPNTGVPRRKAREATVAVSPSFATEKRIQHYHATKEEDEIHTSFHARPLPKRILEARQGIKDVTPKPLTDPKSPAFALKNRLRSGNKSDIEEDHIVRANPLPNMEDVFIPQIQRSVVRVEPFSQEFDARNEMILRHKELKVAQLREEKKREIEEHRAFRARDPEVLHKEPFIPQKSMQPLTDVTDVKLNTSRRHDERQEWESFKADNERRIAVLKQEEDRRLLEEEKKEVDRLRKEAVHKAQPVRHYKNVIVQKSTIPLTNAQSPRFSKRLRERNPNVL